LGQSWLLRLGLWLSVTVGVYCAAHAQAPVIVSSWRAELGAPEENDEEPVPEFWLEPMRPWVDYRLPRPRFGEAIGVEIYVNITPFQAVPLEAMQVPTPNVSVPVTEPLALVKPVTAVLTITPETDGIATTGAILPAVTEPPAPSVLPEFAFPLIVSSETGPVFKTETDDIQPERVKSNVQTRAPKAAHPSMPATWPTYSWPTAPTQVIERPARQPAPRQAALSTGSVFDVLLWPWRQMPNWFRRLPPSSSIQFTSHR